MATKLQISTKHGPDVCDAQLDCEGRCRKPTKHLYFGYWLKGLKLQTKYVEHWFKCQTCGSQRVWGTAWITDKQLETILGETKNDE